MRVNREGFLNHHPSHHHTTKAVLVICPLGLCRAVRHAAIAR